MLLDVIITENRKIHAPLIKTDHLPPKTAEDEPDENVGDATDGADAEVILKLDEAGAEVARGLPRGVVRDAAEEVGVESHGEADQYGRRAGSHHHRHERRGKRGDLRGLRREQVVNGKVATVEQKHDLRPRQVGRRQCAGDGGGEIIDETQGVELTRHTDQDGEPQQRIPSALFVQALGPGNDAGDELKGHPEHGGDDGRDAKGLENPHEHRDAHRSDDHELILRQRTEFFQLCRRLRGSVGRALHLRWVQLVHQERGDEQTDDRRDARRLEPRDPRRSDDDAERSRELETQQVLSRRGHAHRARVSARLQLRLHQKRPELARRRPRL